MYICLAVRHHVLGDTLSASKLEFKCHLCGDYLIKGGDHMNREDELNEYKRTTGELNEGQLMIRNENL